MLLLLLVSSSFLLFHNPSRNGQGVARIDYGLDVAPLDHAIDVSFDGRKNGKRIRVVVVSSNIILILMVMLRMVQSQYGARVHRVGDGLRCARGTQPFRTGLYGLYQLRYRIAQTRTRPQSVGNLLRRRVVHQPPGAFFDGL